MTPSTVQLDQDWYYTQATDRNHDTLESDWQKCSSFPTSIHVELKKAGKIPDPFKDLNEWDVQWIQEVGWDFKTTFDAAQLDSKAEFVDVIFEGLDTYCDVHLNGHAIRSTNNMFMPHRLSLKEYLRPGTNDLLLRFKSPWYEARREEQDNGGKRQCWNGDPNRLYSRKAQYGWGWDWGPVMMTVGPWKNARIEAYDFRIDDVRVDYDLMGEAYDQASVRVRGEIVSAAVIAGSVAWTLKDASGEHIASGQQDMSGSAIDFRFEVKNIAAWYPRGYGAQPLYNLELRLSKSSKANAVATSNTRIAFRTVKLIQEPLIDQEGTSFLFEVNGIRIFCGGSNWIPADSFLTEINDERYRSWIKLMAEGNQNMLRIWGGGVYESEALYDACDNEGILVWQDFMFGCGIYPSYPAFDDNVKSEAESIVKRLRHHPSVVLFAGNNEDYAIAESLDLADDSDQSGSYSDTKFPARQVYEVILPEVVERLSNISYHRGSPYGGKTSSDPTVGDIHQWNVWHGTQEPWSNWDKLAGRFVSEFGMQGYPDRRTVDKWSMDNSQLYPQSRVSMQHNKADGCERRLELYLIENFRHSLDMPPYIYYTQLMQAECIGAAYRLWRRNWKGRGKEYTAGALVWQLNDCWPCASWAVVDYYLRPKPAYFAIKHEMAPYTVGMARRESKVKDDESSEAYYQLRTELQLWACNSTLTALPVSITLSAYDLESDEVHEDTLSVTLAPNSSTEVFTGALPLQPVRASLSQSPRPIVVHARLSDKHGQILARYSSWPEPYKYLSFPEPGLTIDVKGEEVKLSCKKPVKGIILDAEGDEDVKWSDQAIDLFPGDPQRVRAEGLGERKVLVRYLGSDGL